jgi:hypothetical protein
MATKRRSKTAPHASEVSRRRFLQSVIAASAATGAAAALPAVAARSKPAPGTANGVAAVEAVNGYQVFSEEQADLFAHVLNRLIPAEGVMPAAGEIGLGAYVDSVLADAAHLRQPVFDILNEVALAGEAVVLSPQSLDALLVRLERTRPESFASLIEAAYTGYYSHPQVLQAIGWSHPGDEADASETLDVALLEDVVQRGPFYRQV